MGKRCNEQRLGIAKEIPELTNSYWADRTLRWGVGAWGVDTPSRRNLGKLVLGCVEADFAGIWKHSCCIVAFFESYTCKICLRLDHSQLNEFPKIYPVMTTATAIKTVGAIFFTNFI